MSAPNPVKLIQLPYQFEIRHYQYKLWQYLEHGGKRAVWVVHRKGGKDLLAINAVACQVMKRIGLYWYIFPTQKQANEVIWQGRTKEIIYKGQQMPSRSFLSYFPNDLVLDINNTSMRITFRHPQDRDLPGSVFQLMGADNPDALRGPNPIFTAWSEFSQTIEMKEAWNIVRPVLAQNSGVALFIYTPVMKHGETLYNMAQRNPSWFSEILTVDDTYEAPADKVMGWSKAQIAGKYSRVVTKEAIEEERAAGMSEEDIQREFYCSFKSPAPGAWYAKEIGAMGEGVKGRITKVDYIPSLPVDVAWDLGWDDDMALWFIQIVGNEIHLIDCHAQNHIDLPGITSFLKSKPYKVYGKQYLPHDVWVTELGPGKSRCEQLITLGAFRYADVVDVEAHNEVEGNNVVRSLFSRFWIDSVRCDEGLEALRNYGQRFDKRNEVYKLKHDKYSHFASALRTFAVGFRDPIMRGRNQQRRLQMETPEEPLLR